MHKAKAATSQQAEKAAVVPLFASLDQLEQMLAGKDSLAGSGLTDVRIRLFITIVRFDSVSIGCSKRNLRTICSGRPACAVALLCVLCGLRTTVRRRARAHAAPQVHAEALPEQ